MISIDISDRTIYMLETKGKGNKISILRGNSVPLEKNPVDENTGLDRETLKEKLELLLDGCTGKDVSITFSSLPIISNGYRLPYVKKSREQREVVVSKAAQTMSAEDFILDYRITKIIEEEDGCYCNVVTYLTKREIVEETMELIKELKKTPKLYYITQDSIFNFAQAYIPQETAIICNMTEEKVMLHLINKPDNVVTRISYMDETNSLDLLSVIEKGSVDAVGEAASQISKLIQYQAIKSAGRTVSAIYIMGELANEENLKKLKDEFSDAVKLLSELNLPFKVNKEIFNGYIYALSSVIEPI